MKYRITHFWVNAFGVEDGTIVFDDTNASCTGTGQVAACVKTDITETLYDKSLKQNKKIDIVFKNN